MGKVIGIDLGTTNSVIGLRILKSEIINNAEGEILTPSVVHYSSDHTISVGRAALNTILQDPLNTVRSIKRLMGRSFSDPEVQRMMNHAGVSYKICVPNQGTSASVVVQLSNGEQKSPPEVSAEILKKLKQDAENYLKDEVTEAVITVPAYFNEKQKHATYKAAELAGFKISRLLSEPSAAAIAYGIDESPSAKTILIYDFGGGTLDISILTYSNGHFMEQAKGGDMWLGGDDIDHLISEKIKNRIEEEYQIISFEGFLESLSNADRLRLNSEIQRAAENAKVQLSQQDQVVIEINSAVRTSNGARIEVVIDYSRYEFEKDLSVMLERSEHLIRKTLESIHFSSDMIDEVLMVGGSSYIPAFQNSLRKLFGEAKVKVHQRPMTAIAEGAAILAQKMTGQTPELMGEVLYRSAHDYYLKLANGEYLSLVEKQSPLPIKVTKNLKYEETSQLIGHFSFYSKQEDKADEYQAIGDLWLSHIPENIGLSDQDTTPEVEMEFTLTEDELVHVAVCLKNDSAVTVAKTISRGREDERLFHELIAAIQKTNNEQDHIKRFNFLYHSAAIAQGISESFLQIDELSSQVITQKIEKIKNKLHLAINAIEKPETSNMWNELLRMNNLYDFGTGMGALKGEEAKKCRQQISEARLRLLNFESLDEVKNVVKQSLDYVDNICPDEVKEMLYYSSAQGNLKSGMGKVGTGLKI